MLSQILRLLLQSQEDVAIISSSPFAWQIGRFLSASSCQIYSSGSPEVVAVYPSQGAAACWSIAQSILRRQMFERVTARRLFNYPSEVLGSSEWRTFLAFASAVSRSLAQSIVSGGSRCRGSGDSSLLALVRPKVPRCLRRATNET